MYTSPVVLFLTLVLGNAPSFSIKPSHFFRINSRLPTTAYTVTLVAEDGCANRHRSSALCYCHLLVVPRRDAMAIETC